MWAKNTSSCQTNLSPLFLLIFRFFPSWVWILTGTGDKLFNSARKEIELCTWGKDVSRINFVTPRCVNSATSQIIIIDCIYHFIYTFWSCCFSFNFRSFQVIVVYIFQADAIPTAYGVVKRENTPKIDFSVRKELSFMLNVSFDHDASICDISFHTQSIKFSPVSSNYGSSPNFRPVRLTTSLLNSKCPNKGSWREFKVTQILITNHNEVKYLQATMNVHKKWNLFTTLN